MRDEWLYRSRPSIVLLLSHYFCDFIIILGAPRSINSPSRASTITSMRSVDKDLVLEIQIYLTQSWQPLDYDIFSNRQYQPKYAQGRILVMIEA